VLAFDEFTFDLERRLLRHRGLAVGLEPRVAELLAYLLEQRGRIVSRQELLSQLWPDRNASDDALNYAASALRRALSASTKPTLSGLRGQGYRFDAVTRDVTPELDAQRLIGRSPELVRLRKLAARCIDERASGFALLTGTAGIGKTRLLRAISAEWLASGQPCVHGQCTLSEGAPPLWPWWSLLEELKPAVAIQSRADRDPNGPSRLDLPVSSADRWAYFGSLREALERAARKAPLLIALEDLQLADDASLALLRFLACEQRPCPVFYLASYRTPLGGETEPLFRELMRHAEVVALGPLDEGGSRRLLRGVLGAPLGAQREREALASAGGNPLFIKEIALALRSQPDRAVGDLSAASLPGTEAAISWHLSALGEQALQVLSVAAVAGEAFDARLVAAALREPAGVILPALAAAAKLEIVRACSELEYRFVHSLFRQHLYAALPDQERRQLHYRLGISLVQNGQHRSGLGLSQAAHHLAEGALDASQAGVAAEVARCAADSLVERFAFETAAREYRRALRLSEWAGSAGAARVALMIRATECLRVAGLYAEAQQLAREAVELARTLSDQVCLAEATCALVNLELMLPDRAGPHLELLRESAQRVPASEVCLRARLLGHLAMAMFLGSRLEERLAVCDEALRLGLGQDEKTRALVLYARAITHWGLLAYRRDWDDWVEQSVRAAHAAHEPQRELHGLCLQLIGALEAGEIELAQRRAFVLEERGRTMGSAYGVYLTRAFAAGLAVFRGSPDAEALCHSTYEFGKSSMPEHAEHLFQGHLLMLGLEAGRARSVLPGLLALGAARDAHPIYVSGLGLAQTLAGDEQGARATHDRLRAPGFLTAEDSTALAVLSLSAEVCAQQRDREQAALLYQRLAPFSDRVGVAGACMNIPAIPGYALARLAVVLGKAEAAREHLLEARQLCERLGSPPWVRRCSLGLTFLESGGKPEEWAPRGVA
jgi:DNA-binding winged helix-turn-helix (wHTH) protein